MIRKFYETEGLEMKGANTPHPSTPAGKEEAKQAWQVGDYRDAVKLLYASISAMIFTTGQIKDPVEPKEIIRQLRKIWYTAEMALSYDTPSPQSEQAGEKVETLHPEQEKQYPILLEDFGKDFLNALDFMQDYSGDKAKLRVAANTIMQIADGSIRYLCPALWQAASQEKGVGYSEEEMREAIYLAIHKAQMNIAYEDGETNEAVASNIIRSIKPAPDTVQGQEELWEEAYRILKCEDESLEGRLRDLKGTFTLTKNS